MSTVDKIEYVQGICTAARERGITAKAESSGGRYRIVWRDKAGQTYEGPWSDDKGQALVRACEMIDGRRHKGRTESQVKWTVQFSTASAPTATNDWSR